MYHMYHMYTYMNVVCMYVKCTKYQNVPLLLLLLPGYFYIHVLSALHTTKLCTTRNNLPTCTCGNSVDTNTTSLFFISIFACLASSLSDSFFILVVFFLCVEMNFKIVFFCSLERFNRTTLDVLVYVRLVVELIIRCVVVVLIL